MCLNEAKMIPHFLAHYAGLVDEFHVFDNGSTDDSLRLLSGDERIVVQPTPTIGGSFCDTYRALMDEVWKVSRGRADWVATAEMDEHLFHPDLRAYLRHCHETGVTYVQPLGYDMVADSFPTIPGPFWPHLVRGVRQPIYDKPALFRPDQIAEINYADGRHVASPTGHVAIEPQRQVRLLHYKSLGVDYICERNEALAPGLGQIDIASRRGEHYLRDRSAVEHDFNNLRVQARRVPGLSGGGGQELEPTLAEELAILAASGLFDEAHYLATNLDVGAAGFDPLLHFCTFGWREGRRPNAHFDPAWYRRTYRAEVPDDVNPLLDYVLRGEVRGRCPTAYFDPELYRLEHRLRAGISPLRTLLDATQEPTLISPGAAPTPGDAFRNRPARGSIEAGVRNLARRLRPP